MLRDVRTEHYCANRCSPCAWQTKTHSSHTLTFCTARDQNSIGRSCATPIQEHTMTIRLRCRKCQVPNTIGWHARRRVQETVIERPIVAHHMVITKKSVSMFEPIDQRVTQRRLRLYASGQYCHSLFWSIGSMRAFDRCTEGIGSCTVNASSRSRPRRGQDHVGVT
ncbi:hypothetical protein CC86DRAFT_9737 [Ophiobolus disseminans]|uniref:Uncharacterized protein n=1 Tax=Ophiobolus disseminans TaxID=1469910 RepID=A0A6A7AL93_9PLEO|nr:hypothetical protein CC86DRAFT_9737 [Ophiobolus disseminans]